ncbi:hypothetical protein [Billgrantia ethanolica]|uniref:Uncharacterized protein n=1 Tax=Billgrantia ethanolica TaxID=2733486 RepID=A0ABS9A8J7_9GAMM|nr:hypothetical protein [Halomonas ethanolica]MCE8005146.1 hypothetical protein [Halomonas ethanolica]
MKKMIFLLSAGAGLLVLGVVASLLFYGQGMKVTIDREGSARQCPPSRPIFVQVSNYSFKTVKRAYFRLELFKGNHSINLLSSSYRIFDKVVSPFSREHLCYSDEYIDRWFVVGNIYSEGNEDYRVFLGPTIQEVNAAVKFGGLHSVFLGGVEYDLAY